jgi:hypothetical protein
MHVYCFVLREIEVDLPALENRAKGIALLAHHWGVLVPH